jgi:hypothetical protein
MRNPLLSKPSTLFTKKNAIGRQLAHPLTTPFLIAIEIGFIWFLRQRPTHDFPWALRTLVFFAIAQIFVVSVGYVFALFLIFIGAPVHANKEGLPPPGAIAGASPTTSTGWRSHLFHREFFVFILIFPLTNSWLNRTKDIPADRDLLQRCVRSLHFPAGLRALAVSLQAHPNPTRSEFANFCVLAAQADAAVAPAKPDNIAALMREYYFEPNGGQIRPANK